MTGSAARSRRIRKLPGLCQWAAGFIYGYPLVDLLKQRHNETHRVSPTQPVAAPVNTIAIYPHLLTPETQGQLRAANADTLYLMPPLDLSKRPVLIDVPAFGARYYTLAFMDLYGAPNTWAPGPMAVLRGGTR